MTPEQCRAARGLLGWTQPELAAEANLKLLTIVEFETGQEVIESVPVHVEKREAAAAARILCGLGSLSKARC